MAFVIFLSSVMLGTSYIIPVTVGVIFILALMQLLNSVDIVHPDRSILSVESSFGDVASYGTIFSVYALIAWIAGFQKENALRRTINAEKELEKERDLLEVRLQERTQSLREAQVKETFQLYRFAELGQLTTVILHELANNLSVLSLDINDLHVRHTRSKSIKRAQESIDYIEGIVERVRAQLKDSHRDIRFNAYKVISESTLPLKEKLMRQNISLELTCTDNIKSLYLFGDPLRLSQTLIILINNSIDAYARSKNNKNRHIIVNLIIVDNNLQISIIDFGPGISLKVRSNLFSPLSSSKQNGLGIGLFIAKHVVETHFKGTLVLLPKVQKRTEFMINIPLRKDPSKISSY